MLQLEVGRPVARTTPWAEFSYASPSADFGKSLVKLSSMSTPPRFFVAGPDALDAVRPVMEARLKDMQEHEDLSKAMVGNEGPLETHPSRR